MEKEEKLKAKDFTKYQDLNGLSDAEIEAYFQAISAMQKKRDTVNFASIAGLPILGAIVGYFIGDYLWGSGFTGIILGGMAGIMLAGFVCFVGDLTKKVDYKKEYKRLVVPIELRKAFSNVIYSSGLLTESKANRLIRALGVFTHTDSVISNDNLEGTYKGVNFFRSDVNVKREEEVERQETQDDGTVDTKTETIIETMFKGSFTSIEREKPYPTRLLFYTEGFPNVIKLDKNKELVTEHMDFNRTYDVTCDDQIQGRVILSPNRMEMLRRMDNTINGHFAVLFDGNQLSVFISGENLFEVSSAKGAMEQKEGIVQQVTQLKNRMDLLLEIEE